MSAGPAVVALLCKDYPVPPEAGTPRAFHLLHGLCDRTTVHGVAGLFGDRAAFDDFLARSGLGARFASVRVHGGEHDAPPGAAALSFLARRPPFDARFKDPSMLRAARRDSEAHASGPGPVVFYCVGIETLQYVPSRLWRSCVVEATDAQSLLLRRRIRSERMSVGRRLRLRLALGELLRFEARMFRETAAVIYNSSDDIAHLRRDHPDAPLVRVPDGCDTAYFRPDAVPDAEEPDLIVFTGHMRYPPNADAAVHLVEDVMPLVWRRRPGVRALLIGPEPPERLRRLHDGERVTVTGFVDDVRPYLARSTVVAAPVRFGTGMKNKLQSALAMNKAMVATSVTCEGFDDVESGRHVLVADGAEPFAAAVVSLLEDPERRAALGRAGGELIRARYGWDASVDVLWETLRAAAALAGGTTP